jgi:hypothetical protein
MSTRDNFSTLEKEANVDSFCSDSEEMKLKIESLTREKDLTLSEIRTTEYNSKQNKESFLVEKQSDRRSFENYDHLFSIFKDISLDKKVEKSLEERLFELENILMINKRKEIRFLGIIEELKEENRKLKEELDDKTKFSSTNKNLIDIDEDEEDLNNVENLKDIILELSKQYDETKLNYQNLLSSYSEKEKDYQNLKEKYSITDQEKTRIIKELESEIRELKNSNDKKESNKRSRNRSSILNTINYDSYCQDNLFHTEANDTKCVLQFTEDSINMDIKNEQLNKELELKLKELEEDKMNYRKAMKETDEYYQNIISKLKIEISNYQDTINIKDDYKVIIQEELEKSEILRQQLEKQNINLKSNLEEALFGKNRLENEFNSRISKLTDEIYEAHKVFNKLDMELQQALKDSNELKFKNEKISKQNHLYTIECKKMEQEIKQLYHDKIQFENDLSTVNNEKELMFRDYLELKKEFADLKTQNDELISNDLEKMREENKALRRIIKKENITIDNRIIKSKGSKINTLRRILKDYSYEDEICNSDIIENKEDELKLFDCDGPEELFDNRDGEKINLRKNFTLLKRKLKIFQVKRLELLHKLMNEKTNIRKKRYKKNYSQGSDLSLIMRYNKEHSIKYNSKIKLLNNRNKTLKEEITQTISILKKELEQLKKTNENLLGEMIEYKIKFANNLFEKESEILKLNSLINKLKGNRQTQIIDVKEFVNQEKK